MQGTSYQGGAAGPVGKHEGITLQAALDPMLDHTIIPVLRDFPGEKVVLSKCVYKASWKKRPQWAPACIKLPTWRVLSCKVSAVGEGR